MTEIEKYLTHKSKGGYSDCIYGSSLKTSLWKGSTIPNCIGLAWGLFNYDRNTKDKFKRMNGNANEIYEKCKKNGSGFWVSKTPKERAIACYNIGAQGHVVYIWKLFTETSAIMIESNYSGTIANQKAIRFLYGNPKSIYKGYQGCIYNFT